MTLKKLTPVLLVESIEPCLHFWEKLGFSRTVEVPHGDHLGFVILVNGYVEVMYQTVASVKEDIPPLAAAPLRGAFLYIEVDDLDAIERALSGAPLVVPRRKTFYGADEVIVLEPGGNTITLAQFPQT